MPVVTAVLSALAFVAATSAIAAYLVMLSARAVARAPLQYGSAFLATFAASLVGRAMAYVVVHVASPGVSDFVDTTPGMLVAALVNLVVLTLLLRLLGRTADGGRITLRAAVIAAVVGTVFINAIGLVLIYAVYTPRTPSVMLG